MPMLRWTRLLVALPRIALAVLLALSACGDGASRTGSESPPAAQGGPAQARDDGRAPDQDDGRAPDQDDGRVSSQDDGSALPRDADLAGDPDSQYGARRGAPPPVVGLDSSGRSHSTLEFERDSLDLGQIEQQVYPVEFGFQVEGPEPVVVQDIVVSCGCTEAHLEIEGEKWELGRPIPAGAEGRLVGTFDARPYVRTKQASITLRGDASNMPVQLAVRAFIEPAFLLQPERINVGRVRLDLSPEKLPSWTVRVQAGKPFEILRWSAMPEGVIVEDTGRVEDGPGGKGQVRYYEVKLTGEGRAGPLYGQCIAQTSLGLDFRIPLRGVLVGPVEFFPPGRISFGIVEQGDQPSRPLRVQATSGDVELPTPRVLLNGSAVFEVVPVEEQAGQRYGYQIRVRSDAAPGTYRATLRVEFPAGSGLEAHEAPVDAVIRARP